MGSHEAGDLTPRQTSRSVQQTGADVDFIDFIAFFWRWRFWLLMSASLGIASGVFLKLLNDRGRLARVEPSHLRWKLEYSMDKSNPDDHSIPPLLLMDFLKTPSGSSILYDSVNKLFEPAVFSVAEWSAKQQSGTGLISSMEFDGFRVLLTLNTPGSINEDDIRNRIVPGISGAINLFNTKYFQASESIRSEAIEARLRLSEIALQTSNILQESRNLDSGMKPRTIGAAKNRPFILPEKKSVQELELWLAAIPNSDPRKKSLIESYQNTQLIQESIDFRKKALLKAAGLENIFKLDVLNPANLEKIEFLSAAATSPSVGRFGNLSAGLMGGFFGLATAMVLVSFLSFFEKNRDRLKNSISSQDIKRV